MKKEIKSISVLQTSKVLAFLGFLLSALYALPIAIYMLLYGEDKSLALAFFMLPVIYLIVGFIANVILSFFYNIVARIFGGVEVEVVNKEE